MLLYPPVECNKGYLITVFQAGKMEFPEPICFDAPLWSPVKYYKFCVDEFSELVQHNRSTACIPKNVHRDGVLQSYWKFGRMSQGWIGFYECFRFLKEHYENVQNRPEDWWKDISPDDFHRVDKEPWGKAPQEEIEAWLDRYTHFTGEFRVRESERKEGVFNDNREIVLMPPLRVGLKGQYLFQVSPDVEPMLLTCSVAGVRAIDYFKMWVKNLEDVWEYVNGGTLLVLDADELGRPWKWSIAFVDENECVHFSYPFERVLDDYTWNRETGFFDCSDNIWSDCLEKASFGEAVYTKEAFDRWLTAGRDLVNMADMTDEDDWF